MSKGENSISFATQRANTTKYKIVFVGDQGVGKSSIITSFIKSQFDTSHNPTVGVDFVSKNLNIKGKNVRLQLWDTAGQERFRSLIPSYLKDCNAAFIVYDIANEASFESITRWLDFVKQSRGKETIMYLLGNKTDLENQRAVSKEKVEELAKKQDIPFAEISAKTGEKLNEVFRILCSKLTGYDLDEQDMYQSQIKGLKGPALTEPSEKNKKGDKLFHNQQIKTQNDEKRKANKQKQNLNNNSIKITNQNPRQPQRVRSTCC